MIVYAVTFTQMYAERSADRIKSGSGKLVQFWLAAGETVTAKDPLPAEAILLGTTGKFVFLYSVPRKATYIVPIENLARLVIPAERRRRTVR